jgi:hypothetical protein
MSRRTCWAGAVFLLLLTLYVGSYLYLSRKGIAECDALGYTGLYFSPPVRGREWEDWNFRCVWFYWPLIKVDRWLGTGREPGCVPLWGLEK